VQHDTHAQAHRPDADVLVTQARLSEKSDGPPRSTLAPAPRSAAGRSITLTVSRTQHEDWTIEAGKPQVVGDFVAQ
jgi:hypothetical protein